ncbi:MAG: hypothetical protein ACM33V_06445 [Chloroflexota bacterium]
MNNQSSTGRELLIPILLGGFSILGIIAVLVVGRSLNAPAEIDTTPSSTPFQYIFIGTEPAITTLIVEGSDIAPEMTEELITEEPIIDEPIMEETIEDPPVFNTPTFRPIFTPTFSTPRTSTPSRTSAPTRTSTPSAANTYDDTDARLIYSGSWTSQGGVSGAYQDTLHISYTIGNAVTFTFSGTEIRFYYQAGPSLGTVTIFIDDDTLGTTVSEAQGGSWIHALTSGTHNILIKHTSGGSVNIDRIVIPSATATPTRTPTP